MSDGYFGMLMAAAMRWKSDSPISKKIGLRETTCDTTLYMIA